MHWAAQWTYRRRNYLPSHRCYKTQFRLNHFKGKKPTQIRNNRNCQNYLNEDELNLLNRMVNAYLELAELQALNRNLCI